MEKYVLVEKELLKKILRVFDDPSYNIINVKEVYDKIKKLLEEK